MALQERLGAVLVDLEFPARRWQVLTVGDLYGIDTATRSLLEQLPERRYQSLAEVAGVLAAVLMGRHVSAVGTAGAPPQPPTTRRPVRAVPARPVAPVRRPVPSTPVA